MAQDTLFRWLSLIGVGAGIWYLWNSNRVALSAEEEEVTIAVHDYGSITNPVSYMHGDEGKAHGQVAQDYGITESMTAIGVGQNYDGRAFGL